MTDILEAECQQWKEGSVCAFGVCAGACVHTMSTCEFCYLSP